MNIEPLVFEVDGQKLKGKFYEPKDSSEQMGFLFIHGWTGRPNENAAKVMAENGFYAMTISLRGHNDSEGDINHITRDDSMKDALAAYDLFRQKLPGSTVIGVVGSSYGSYIAARLSKEREVGCLSLRVPANYPSEGSDKPQMGHGHENPRVDLWRQQTLTYQENNALSAIHNFKGPIQVIEAELDELVPHQTVQNYVDAVSDQDQLEYLVMKDWTHSLGEDKPRNAQFQQLLLSWAQRQK
jgi:esterase/lipase